MYLLCPQYIYNIILYYVFVLYSNPFTKQLSMYVHSYLLQDTLLTKGRRMCIGFKSMVLKMFLCVYVY